jgi:hypothetical protein
VTSLRRTSPIARAAACRLLTELRIEEAADLDIELVAASKGAAILRRKVAGCDGRLLRAGPNALIVVDEKAYDSAKWRFTVAHELGHLLLHKNADPLKLCTERDLNDYKGSGNESEANDFAAELLMPRSIFARRCDVQRPSLTHIRKLATEFATSLSSTALRFVECSPEPCAFVYSQAGRITWWSKNEGFALWLERGGTLSPDTYAFDVGVGKTVDDRMQLTDARAWCDKRAADDVELFEHPMSLPALGAVVTLLWHPG